MDIVCLICLRKLDSAPLTGTQKGRQGPTEWEHQQMDIDKCLLTIVLSGDGGIARLWRRRDLTDFIVNLKGCKQASGWLVNYQKIFFISDFVSCSHCFFL